MHSNPLRDRSYRLALGGQFASTVGDYCYTVALPWMVLAHHGSAATLGVVLACYGVPRTVLIPVGGALCDRLTPRVLLIGTCLVRGLATVGLALLATQTSLDIPVLIALAVILGAGEGLFLPGSFALLPALLTPDSLQAGNGYFEVGMQLGGVIGPGIGGLLVAAAGPSPAFAVDAASFAMAAVALFLMPGGRAGSVDSDKTGPDATPFLQYLRSAHGLQVSVVLCVVANLGFTGCDTVALPALAHQHFGAAGFGIALTALAGGALLGAIISSRLSGLRRPAMVASASFLGAALAVALIPVGVTLANAVAWMAVLGGCISLGNVILVTALQRDVPPRLVGRAMALLMLASFGAAPLSAAVSGVAVGRFGPAPFFPVAGALLALAVLLGLTQRSFRNLPGRSQG